nr:immunoglobulin heavy chain junction region [Macaca mulatta]MOV39094.1 immunoglobulin heavy chain junction region [Macaca mulatta]MOV42976.1 immunoglobulin heavy chain junction region [Macaca mulatta]MOV44185.1 immunoglobulin heavy chain junction region [Macaca mulatta]MOV87404.1 immunoglobulin heavy chain junction region [Macaca mulatta]
CARKEDSFDVW